MSIHFASWICMDGGAIVHNINTAKAKNGGPINGTPTFHKNQRPTIPPILPSTPTKADNEGLRQESGYPYLARPTSELARNKPQLVPWNDFLAYSHSIVPGGFDV